jgi:hypothetical protein
MVGDLLPSFDDELGDRLGGGGAIRTRIRTAFNLASCSARMVRLALRLCSPSS